MRFAPLRIDGSFTLHALTAGKKRGEKRPWKILPLLFPPSQQQTPLSDSRQLRKCAGRMPPPFLPPSLLPSLGFMSDWRWRASGRAARVVGSPLPHDDVFPPGLARSIPPSFRCNAEFTDFSNVAGGAVTILLCLAYIQECFALNFTEMPTSDECLIAVAAAATWSLFALRRPVKRCCIRIRAFSANLPARPVTHSPCCVLPHPMTFAYSPTKDSL